MSHHFVERGKGDLGTAPLVFILALFALLLLVHAVQT